MLKYFGGNVDVTKCVGVTNWITEDFIDGSLLSDCENNYRSFSAVLQLRLLQHAAASVAVKNPVGFSSSSSSHCDATDEAEAAATLNKLRNRKASGIFNTNPETLKSLHSEWKRLSLYQ